MAHAAGRPGRRSIARAQVLAALLAILVVPAAGLTGLATAALAAALIGLLAVRFARAHLGGHTGDVAGATQQVAEIAILLGLLAVASQPTGALP
jgi:adenosylcobinamide-GDP ribazoletransferase